MTLGKNLLAAGVVFAAALAPAVRAADLQVSPISLQFNATEQAQAVWLSNTGTQPLRAQVRLLRWSQPQQGDLLETTRELVASPPALEIAPGQRQLVRVVRLQPAAPAQELSYRMIVDELPPATGAEPAPQKLQFLLRYSVPVFVAPEGPAAAPGASDLSALSARWTRDAQPELGVVNQGRRRLRISAVVHEDAQGNRTVLVPGLLGYVLAGQRMRWPLPAKAQGLPPGTLKATFNDDVQEQAFPLADLPS